MKRLVIKLHRSITLLKNGIRKPTKHTHVFDATESGDPTPVYHESRKESGVACGRGSLPCVYCAVSEFAGTD